MSVTFLSSLKFTFFVSTESNSLVMISNLLSINLAVLADTRLRSFIASLLYTSISAFSIASDLLGAEELKDIFRTLLFLLAA